MMLHVNFSAPPCKFFQKLTFFVFLCVFNNLSYGSDLIAIIDSGLDRNIPQVAGANFFDNTLDTSDQIGHGSALAQEILAVNPKSRFLPVKVTNNGDGITPEILAQAINFSVEKGAKIISLAFAISKGSDDLKKAVKYAAKKEVILVAAAGVGLANPYEPVDVSTIFPQAYPDVLVVGKSISCSEPASDSNFGKKINFVIPEGETKKRGSSYTAARAVGLLSLLKNKKRWQPYLISVPPQFKSKMGQGCLDSKKLIEANRAN